MATHIYKCLHNSGSVCEGADYSTLESPARLLRYETILPMVSCSGCGAVSSGNVHFCSSCGRAINILDAPTLEPDRNAAMPAPVPITSHPPCNGAFSPGTLLVERYRIVALLGRGGMGMERWDVQMMRSVPRYGRTSWRMSLNMAVHFAVCELASTTGSVATLVRDTALGVLVFVRTFARSLR